MSNELTAADRKKSLEILKANARKKWGKEIIIDTANLPEINVISFGSYKVDNVTRIGGIPKGRITQLIGD